MFGKNTKVCFSELLICAKDCKTAKEQKEIQTNSNVIKNCERCRGKERFSVNCILLSETD